MAAIIGRLESLQIMFQGLEKSLAYRIFNEEERGMVKSINDSINNKCPGLIQKLQGNFQAFQGTKTSSNIIQNVSNSRRQKLAYPS